MEKIRGKSLQEWKKYCEKDNVPIKTIKYITCLEERIEALTIPVISNRRELLIAMLEWGTAENMVNQDLNNTQIVDLYLSNL